MNNVKSWLNNTIYKDYRLEIASADASFRKYYRLSGGKTFLLMDASLEKGSLIPFLDITERLKKADVGVPEIFLQDIDNGFLILEDFGSTHYLDVLNTENYKSLYSKAINTILKMQKADANSLPLYDKKFLHVEMDLMSEWYLEKLLHVELNEAQKELIASTLNSISDIVLQQPQGIFVHRDFHSRNIMLKDDRTIGVIDYQDAMSGSLTYDLVSLLKDCYIAYDRKAIKELALEFRDKKAIKADDETFIKWFDFTGMQRHIKVLGIFSRLYLRDDKEGYLKDIPLTKKYLLDTAQRYDETKEFANLLKDIK